MKLLSRLRVSNLVLCVLWVQVVLGAQAQDSKNGFQVLCDVLRHAERVLNSADRNRVALKEALFGRNNGVLAVEKGQVSVKGACNYQTKRELLCTYYAGGKHGCFAQTLAGAILCTCTPDQRGGNFCRFGALNSGGTWSSGWLENQKDLFQKVWDQVKEKCSSEIGSDPTHTEPLDDLKDALDKVRGNLSQADRNSFYLGEPNCARKYGSKSCVTYLGKDRHHVHIPWLDTTQKALEDLKQASPREAILVQTTAPTTGTSPAPKESAPKNPEHLEHSSTPNTTTEREHTEDTFPPGTPSPPENQPSPKSRTRRSTTEDPTAISTAPDDSVILDPTVAPFSSPEGDSTDILTPLGLFMAASSFF
ncbi:Variant surface glycoprotein [Trypanosoma congolense IL3000]|uniref:Variant surface glycoprotein n=1 Tax=Trypanosoma congolense (strain IL3000) TaxID=1068625 RepID=F9WIW2_TRYCI|nr:Variant surface glycoprotein [Trypanosoma congolense IL3000]